jgi:putative ABC transport system permease protein
MFADLVYACRSLRKSPGFTLAAVATLGLGIGANTTVFSLVNAVQFGIPSFYDPATLVDIHEASATRLCSGCSVGTSDPGYRDWLERATSFAAMAPYGEEGFVLSSRGNAERVSGAFVGATLFPILGTKPLLGRAFEPDDDRAGAARVVIISHSLWQRVFGRAASVLGAGVRINGEAATVIGVMPADFVFPEFAELWVPFNTHPHDMQRSTRDFGVVARLKPAVSIRQADIEMQGIARNLEREYPGDQAEWTARVTSLRDDMASDTGSYFWVLLGAVGLVLLATCASLAGLLLARATGRSKEIAVRAALGASRARLIRHLLTESVVIGLLGGAVGLLIALWGVDLAAAGFTREAPRWVHFGIDSRVLAFCFGMSVLTGIVFGAIPAFRASRPQLNESLKEGSQATTSGRGRQRLRAGLVVAELALALVLLNGAGLLIKAFMRVSRVPPTYDIRNLLLANLSFVGPRYDDSTQVLATTNRIVDRLNAMPQIHAAGSHFMFLAGFGASDEKITVDGIPALPEHASPRFAFAITSSYFRTFGLAIERGRDFTANDRMGMPPVAIVNREMARRVWPGQDPLGKRFKLGASDATIPWLTVVGVVANEDGEGTPDQPPVSYAYVPLAQDPGRPIALMVRTASDPLALAPVLQGIVRDVDPDLPVENVRTAEAGQAERFWHVRLYAVFFFGFAVFSLLLATIGIYGIVAQTVVQRSHEIGIRVALGAERGRVLRLILNEGARLAALGLGIGIVGSLILTRLLRSMLFGVNPLDPLVLVPVAVLLFVVALVASWWPARRAMQVDPMLALRTE